MILYLKSDEVAGVLNSVVESDERSEELSTHNRLRLIIIIIIWTNGKDFVFCLLLNNNWRREKMTTHRKVRFDGILLWILLWLDLLD